MLLAGEETYNLLTTFEDVESMNEVVREHRSNHDLNATEEAVLDYIARHSCVYPGVSFLTKNNIGKAVDKSRRTVIRVCNRLESLGIISQHALKRRKDMYQTSNAIVILPEVTAPNIEVKDTNVTQDVSHHKALRSIKPKATKVIDTATVRAEALRNSIPEEIFSAFSNYYNADEIYKYYGLLLRAKNKAAPTVLIENCPEPFTDAIHAVSLKTKQNKLSNLDGYFYKAFMSAASTADRLMNIGNNPLYFDWLNE